MGSKIFLWTQLWIASSRLCFAFRQSIASKCWTLLLFLGQRLSQSSEQVDSDEVATILVPKEGILTVQGTLTADLDLFLHLAREQRIADLVAES